MRRATAAEAACDVLKIDVDRLRGLHLETASPAALNALEADLDAALVNVRAAKAARVPDDFFCPITQEIMVDPVICSDGYSYERTAITTWLEKHTTSPQTNLDLATTQMIPNIALRNAIAAFREAHRGDDAPP